jgi:hypothetical protein
MAQLAIGGVAVAVSAAFFVAVPQSASLAATPTQSAASFESLAKSDLLLRGTIEQFNAKSFQIRVLGQVVVLPEAQHQLAADGNVGRMVAAYGSIASNGSLKVTHVTLLTSTEYVAG